MMALRHANVEPQPAATVSPTELKRQRQDGPGLEKPLFNLHAKDRYTKLFNFIMEVTSIIKTKHISKMMKEMSQ